MQLFIFLAVCIGVLVVLIIISYVIVSVTNTERRTEKIEARLRLLTKIIAEHTGKDLVAIEDEIEELTK